MSSFMFDKNVALKFLKDSKVDFVTYYETYTDTWNIVITVTDSRVLHIQYNKFGHFEKLYECCTEMRSFVSSIINSAIINDQFRDVNFYPGTYLIDLRDSKRFESCEELN